MAIWPGDPQPDQIDMMSEDELRTELRSVLLKLDPGALFEFVKHGDAEHQAWLREALEAWVAGAPKPEPRGLGKHGAKIYALEAEVKALTSRLNSFVDVVQAAPLAEGYRIRASEIVAMVEENKALKSRLSGVREHVVAAWNARAEGDMWQALGRAMDVMEIAKTPDVERRLTQMTRPTLTQVRGLVGWSKNTHAWKVEETERGIRIYTEYYRGDDSEILGRIMSAALHMKLDPAQVEGRLCYEDGDSCPTCGYDPTFGIDVTFLFEPASE